MDELRIGLIGAGRIAHVHAESYRRVSGGKLVAVADVIKPAAEKMAAQYGMDAYQDYRDILARSDIDAVAIATPNWLHAEIAIAAAQAGKHIFCEKPIALTVADADAMIQAAEKAGVVLQVGFMLRFTPPLPRAREIVASGALGNVIALRGAIFGWEPSDDWFYVKEKGGGVILDTMIHFADLVRWFAGPVTSAYTEGGAYVLDGAKRHGSPDNACVTLKHANGAMTQLYITWTSGYGNFFAEVYGSEGSISVNFLEKQGSMLFLKQAMNTETLSLPKGWSYPDAFWTYGYGGEAQYFVDQVQGRTPRGNATGADGRSALEIVIAAQQSLDEKRPIAVGGSS
jgi:myo-inositol 2-dehydrogenase / D-chiro-inositol 1-dehydrogenase